MNTPMKSCQYLINGVILGIEGFSSEVYIDRRGVRSTKCLLIMNDLCYFRVAY